MTTTRRTAAAYSDPAARLSARRSRSRWERPTLPGTPPRTRKRNSERQGGGSRDPRKKGLRSTQGPDRQVQCEALNGPVPARTARPLAGESPALVAGASAHVDV